jgi:hypothetical protein
MSKSQATVLLQSFKPAEIVTLLDNTAKYFRQRSLSSSSVNRYLHDMQAGNWFTETGETIKIARVNGNEIVVDGQHRLHAALRSKNEIFFWVFRYVPLEAFAFLDQHNPRTLKDVLDIHNHGWEIAPTVFASTGTMLWKNSITGSPAIRPTSDQFEAPGNVAHWLILSYKDLPEYYETIDSRLTDIQRGGLGGKAWMLYLAYNWSTVDAALCDKVLDHLACRGAYNYAVASLSKAVEKGKDSPKSSKAMTDLQASEDFIFPNKIMDACRNQVVKFREGSKDPETGKIFKTRNKDLSDFTMFAYQTAWNSLRRGETVASYNTQINAAIATTSYDEIPAAV